MADLNWPDVALRITFDGTGSTYTDESDNAFTITTVGTVNKSSSVVKFGSASAQFFGATDYLSASNALLAIADNTAVFTFEAWVRFAALPPSAYGIFYVGDLSSNTDRSQLTITDGGFLNWYKQAGIGTGASITSTTQLSLDTWHHVAVVQDGTARRLFLDGVLEASDTYSTAITSASDFYIGACRNGGAARFMDGFIDDLRLTVGVARYSASFTPPTDAYPLSDIFETRASIPAPLFAPSAVASVQEDADVRALIPPPLSAPSAVMEAKQSIRALIPTALGVPRTIVVSDFTSQITDPTERYIVQLTGDPVITVPVSSWQGTLQTERSNFLQIVIPASGPFVDALTARRGTEQFVVYRETTIAGQSVRSEMARAGIDTVNVNTGPTRNTATVQGFTSAFDSPVSASTITLENVRSRSQTLGGAARVRCSIDWLLRPGQTVTDGTIEFTAGYINYFVPSAGDSYMDVGSRG